MAGGTGFDALRFFNSGAAADGDAQLVEAANLGGYRSGTEICVLAALGAMKGVLVERIGENNLAGVGAIDSDGTGRLRWTAPESGTPGPWVTVADGNTEILADGELIDRGLRVTRDAAALSAGSQPIKVLEQFNNALGMANLTDTQRSAGRSEYRALFLQNVGAVALDLSLYLGSLGTMRALHASGYAASGGVTVTAASGSFADWPETGYVQNERTGEVLYYASRTSTALTVPAAGRDVFAEVSGGAAGIDADQLYAVPGIRIALEEPSAQPAGHAQTIANVTTAPSDLTWAHPAHAGSAALLTRAALGAGEILALWINRQVPAGAVGSALVENEIVISQMEAA
jgi:hypothetical protein